MADEEEVAGAVDPVLPKVVVHQNEQCSICENALSSIDLLASTPCGHIFHKLCITNYIKQFQSCQCRALCRVNQLQNYTFPLEEPKTDGTGAVPKTRATRARSKSPAANPPSSIDMEQIKAVISNVIRAELAVQRETPSRANGSHITRDPPVRTSNLSPKDISNIVANWHVRFSGLEKDPLTVDNFVYRVTSLTQQNLNGDFRALCNHIHTLFTNKANDWYWRYHRQVGVVEWENLCVEMRSQFRDLRTDFDILELIRARKQQPKEKFDVFYEAIQKLMDRMDDEMKPMDLVALLRRNLRPEVRKETLHFTITSVAQLRQYVQRHELLDEELSLHHATAKTYSSNRQISELESSSTEDTELQVCAIQKAIMCWNCHEQGHRHDDCMAQRTVFCYGCGEPNVYKPQCPRCSSSSKNSSRPRPREPPDTQL